MNAINIILGIANIFTGFLVALLCIPLAKESIGMNKYYGFRFKKSFKSEENWYAINKYGAKQMIFWAILQVIIGILVLFIKLEANTFVYWSILFVPCILFIPVVLTYSYSRQL